MELAFQVSRRTLRSGESQTHLSLAFLTSASLSLQGCYFCVKQFALECSRIPMGQAVNSQVCGRDRGLWGLRCGQSPRPQCAVAGCPRDDLVLQVAGPFWCCDWTATSPRPR